MSHYVNVIKANLGEKIMLIKMVRTLYDLGLKDAKELVELVSDAIVNVYEGADLDLNVFMAYLNYAFELVFGQDVDKALDKIVELARRDDSNNVYREIFTTWVKARDKKVW